MECKSNKKYYPPCELAHFVLKDDDIFYFGTENGSDLTTCYFGIIIRSKCLRFNEKININPSIANKAEVISLNNLTNHSGIATGKQINEFLEMVGL